MNAVAGISSSCISSADIGRSSLVRNRTFPDYIDSVLLLASFPAVIVLGQGVVILSGGLGPVDPLDGHLRGLTPIVWLLAGFVVGSTLLLSRTTFGRRIYAVGNSPLVARFAGVPVGRILIFAYMLSALCAALVGLMLSGFGFQATLEMGDAFLLPSIAAAIVGGTLITGGRGHYLGMFGGALLLTALSTLLSGLLLPAAVRSVIFGGVCSRRSSRSGNELLPEAERPWIRS